MICWALRFGGVANSEERDSFSWQYLSDINSSFIPSIFTDMIRVDLYIVTFDTTTWRRLSRQFFKTKKILS